MTVSDKAFSPCSGAGALEVSCVAGQSAVVSCWSGSPLKILVPRPRGPSVWAYLSSFGGGMVGGDQTKIQVTLNSDVRCFLSTQASTKIYRSCVGRSCDQSIDARLGAESLLVWAPEVVQPFSGASYSQIQRFHLETSSNMVLIDWFSAGRLARGERWSFRRFESRNEVFMDGDLVFTDSLLLDPSLTQGPLPLGRYNCVALVVVIGRMLWEGSRRIAEVISQLSVERCAGIVQSASQIPHGIVLRLAGTTVEEVSRKIQAHLQFVISLLGDDPWQRKW